MDIPGAAGMARAPEGIGCPQCSARLPAESFFARARRQQGVCRARPSGHAGNRCCCGAATGTGQLH
eukprot:11224924-Lingulodinium_polyedra.AAC.1